MFYTYAIVVHACLLIVTPILELAALSQCIYMPDGVSLFPQEVSNSTRRLAQAAYITVHTVFCAAAMDMAETVSFALLPLWNIWLEQL